MEDNQAITLSEVLDKRYKALKEEEGFTHAPVAAAIGHAPSYVSQLLSHGRAQAVVSKWSGEKALAFLQAFKYTTSEIRGLAQQFNLENVIARLDYIKATRYHSVSATAPEVRFMGEVSAGRFGTSYADDALEPVDIPRHVLRRHDPSDIFAVKVSGDSMMCEDAAKSIPEGSIVYFHSRLRPRRGQTVCCRLPESDMSVIKVYMPGRDFTLLESRNASHKPIVLDKDNAGTIEGVYIGLSAADPAA